MPTKLGKVHFRADAMKRCRGNLMETHDHFVMVLPQTAPGEEYDWPTPSGATLQSDEALQYHRLQEPWHRQASVHASCCSEDMIHDASPPDHGEDLGLLEAIAQRDRQAFETLYYRYTPRLGRYLSRLLKQRELVEEVLGEVMLVVWQTAARFDPAAARVSTWLFGIAHDKALKVFARRCRSPGEVPVDTIGVDADAPVPDANHPTSKLDPHGPERTLIFRELGPALERALESLSVEHRAVIGLAFGEDCSYQEIATIVGCPVTTVKTRMFHARKRLAQLFVVRGCITSPTRGGRFR